MTAAAMADIPAAGRDDRGYPTCGGTKRAGGACTRPAGWGTDHPGHGRCKLHGGSTPSGRVHGSRVRAEAGARQIMADLGAPVPVLNPTKRLLEVLGEIDRFREACRLQVEQLGEWVVENKLGDEQAKAVVRLYTEAIDRMGRLLVDAARLRLEERLVAIDEATADMVLTVLEAAMARALPGVDVDPVKRVFAELIEAREVTA
jgi:hypothetical protein